MTNKEWRYILLIIVTIEGFIFYISYIHAGNASALSYVSFSGTLISIILALLAIGYTYGESIRQKNSSDTVVNQISRLNDVIKNIELESESLSEITTVKEELIKLSKSFKEGIDNTHLKVENVNQSINKLLLEYDRFPQKHEVHNTLDKTELAKTLMRGRNPLLEIGYLTILLTKSIRLTSGISISDTVGSYISKAFHEINSEDENLRERQLTNLFVGTSLCIYAICFALGLVEEDDNEIVVHEALKNEILNTIIPHPKSAGNEYNRIRLLMIDDIKQTFL